MRLTVVGCAPAEPQSDTPASGVLIESDDTALLVDCGSGVPDRLRAWRDPRRLDAIVVTHLHADHFLGLAGLRYLFPWAADGNRVRRPGPRVFLPPGGLRFLASLATAISERPTFFEDTFRMQEYEASETLRVDDLRVRLVPARHYVPAVSVEVSDAAGTRIVVSGDTGPNPALEAIARDADAFVCEATLESLDEDGPGRGHLTGPEAVELAVRQGARRTLLTHYASRRRASLEAIAERARVGAGTTIGVARSGSIVHLDPAEARPRVLAAWG